MNTNKPKVLLCAPLRGGIGGIKRWTEHILNYYEENKNDLDIDIELFDTGRKHFIYGDTSKFKRVILGIIDYFSLIKGFRKQISSGKYDAVHITTSASFALIGNIIFLRMLAKRGVKSVVHFRFGRIPQLVSEKNWEYRLLQKVIRLSSSAIVLDQASYRSLVRLGFENIKILSNPLSPKVERIISNHKEKAKKEGTLVFVGHVVEAKGVFELIEACRDIPNIHLKVIGTVSITTKQSLLSLAGNNNEGWLEICGEKEYEEVIEEMLSASIFVLPSYTEGFPNVILESMACGCAIIATYVGAIPEMLNINSSDTCGLIVPPQNVQELKKAIMRMLEDKSFKKKCGENAVKRVREEYSIEQVIKKLIQIWKL